MHAATVSKSTMLNKDVMQVDHGLADKDLVYIDESGIWRKAIAQGDKFCIGIITSVVDADNFVVQFFGLVSGFDNLATSTSYFLSDTAAGGFTNIEPTANRQLILDAISQTEAIFLARQPY